MADPSRDDLSTRVAVNEEAIRSLRQLAEGLAATSQENMQTVREVAAIAATLKGQGREMARMREDLREDLEAVERRFGEKVKEAVDACSHLADRLAKASDQRLVSRATIVVAAIGAGGLVLAAVLSRLLGG